MSLLRVEVKVSCGRIGDCVITSYLLQPPYDTIAKYCNIWRNYGDIQDNWESVYSIIDHYGNNIDKFAEIAAPGQFNDPDEV